MSFLFGLLTNLIKQVNTSLFKLNKENRIIAITPLPPGPALAAARGAQRGRGRAAQGGLYLHTCILAYLY